MAQEAQPQQNGFGHGDFGGMHSTTNNISGGVQPLSQSKDDDDDAFAHFDEDDGYTGTTYTGRTEEDEDWSTGSFNNEWPEFYQTPSQSSVATVSREDDEHSDSSDEEQGVQASGATTGNNSGSDDDDDGFDQDRSKKKDKANGPKEEAKTQGTSSTSLDSNLTQNSNPKSNGTGGGGDGTTGGDSWASFGDSGS